MTIDGEQFYHNVVSDAVAWEKPPELQSEEERQTDTSDCVWLPDEQAGGWEPAYVLARRAGGALSVRRMEGGGGQLEVSAAQARGLHALKKSQLRGPVT